MGGCGAIVQPQSGPTHRGQRPSSYDGGVDIAAAALMEGVWDEHSEVDPEDRLLASGRKGTAAASGNFRSLPCSL
jgi:hypothetical protein